MRFVVRSEVLVNRAYGRFPIGAERSILIPWVFHVRPRLKCFACWRSAALSFVGNVLQGRANRAHLRLFYQLLARR